MIQTNNEEDKNKIVKTEVIDKKTKNNILIKHFVGQINKKNAIKNKK